MEGIASECISWEGRRVLGLACTSKVLGVVVIAPVAVTPDRPFVVIFTFVDGASRDKTLLEWSKAGFYVRADGGQEPAEGNVRQILTAVRQHDTVLRHATAEVLEIARTAHKEDVVSVAFHLQTVVEQAVGVIDLWNRNKTAPAVELPVGPGQAAAGANPAAPAVAKPAAPIVAKPAAPAAPAAVRPAAPAAVRPAAPAAVRPAAPAAARPAAPAVVRPAAPVASAIRPAAPAAVRPAASAGVRPASAAPAGVRPASAAPAGVRPAVPAGVRPAAPAAPPPPASQSGGGPRQPAPVAAVTASLPVIPPPRQLLSMIPPSDTQLFVPDPRREGIRYPRGIARIFEMEDDDRPISLSKVREWPLYESSLKRFYQLQTYPMREGDTLFGAVHTRLRMEPSRCVAMDSVSPAGMRIKAVERLRGWVICDDPTFRPLQEWVGMMRYGAFPPASGGGGSTWSNSWLDRDAVMTELAVMDDLEYGAPDDRWFRPLLAAIDAEYNVRLSLYGWDREAAIVTVFKNQFQGIGGASSSAVEVHIGCFTGFEDSLNKQFDLLVPFLESEDDWEASAVCTPGQAHGGGMMAGKRKVAPDGTPDMEDERQLTGAELTARTNAAVSRTLGME